MITPGLHSLKESIRRTMRIPRSGALILLYHRIAELPFDPFCLAVTPTHFAEHVRVLAENYNVISLEKMLSCLADGRLPPRTVVLTFDDGYFDILTYAEPILAEHAMPATLFVTTGCVESQQEPWWDEMEHFCFSSRALPESLEMRFPGETYVWRDSAPTAESPEQPSAGNRSDWNAFQSVDVTSRQVLFRGLYDSLKPLPPHQREKMIDGLFAWAATPRQRSCHIHRLLSRDEIARLDSRGIVQIGAHTVNHPVLSMLSARDQRDEITGSKRFLEEIVGHEIRTFAYPFGAPGDYTVETEGLAGQAGLACACSAKRGLTQLDGNTFSLPRNWMADCDGDLFERQLQEWWIG